MQSWGPFNRRRVRRCGTGCVLVVVVTVLSGCTMGPTMLRSSRTGYNAAIQRTTSEQLLLNLVRLKYRDRPLFLEVSSVSAQFQFDSTAGLSGTLAENVGVNPINPDVLRLDGGFRFSERPTIVMTPLQGHKFATRLLEPVGLDTILLLIRSGWSADRVLRLTVQQMNGRNNASRASGPTPDYALPYRQFARASALWRDLSWQGAVQVGYEPGRIELSPPIASGSIGASDLLAAAGEGLTFQPAQDKPDSYFVARPSRSLVMRVAGSARNEPHWEEFAETLGLDPSASVITLQAAMEMRVLEGSREKPLRRILIAPRSLMGTLFYLSHAIEVPEAHTAANLVTKTTDADGQPFNWSEVTGDLLRVHSQRDRPRRAAVAIPYRGYWFFIGDDDLESKSTFSLLGQLFALQAGQIGGAGPQLTLPIGG